MSENQEDQFREEVSSLNSDAVVEEIESSTTEDTGDVLQISNAVLVSIVRKYVMSVEGVVRFQNQSLMDGMLDILSKRSDRSIMISMPEEGADISVRVVMRFGVCIPDVAHAIQGILREKIEELTGYTVARVNVTVSDLDEVEEETAPAEEEKPAVADETPEDVPAEPDKESESEEQ